MESPQAVAVGYYVVEPVVVAAEPVTVAAVVEEPAAVDAAVQRLSPEDRLNLVAAILRMEPVAAAAVEPIAAVPSADQEELKGTPLCVLVAVLIFVHLFGSDDSSSSGAPSHSNPIIQQWRSPSTGPTIVHLMLCRVVCLLPRCRRRREVS